MARTKIETPQREDPRTFWALERTFLAWMRTGLALMGFGFVVAKFGLFLRMVQAQGGQPVSDHSSWSMWFGTLLVIVGVLVQVGALHEYIRSSAELKQGRSPVPVLSRLGILVSSCLILIGILMAVYLIL